MRGLLAWYEYTKDEKVLTGIKKAVQRTTQGYPAYQSEQLQGITQQVVVFEQTLIKNK